jgi:hypothetical protein
MNIISRAGWKAEPPRLPPVPMKLPVSTLWLHHSVTGTTDNPQADMRQLQAIAFSRKFSDISYSWAVHSSGTVLEGRGTNVGAHTAGQNSSSFGVVLIGDYTRRVVTDAQVDSVRQLVAWLIARGALNPGLYPTGGHRQAPGAATACPGEFAMRRMMEMRAPWIGVPDPPKEVRPMFEPALILEPIVAELAAPDGGVWLLGTTGAVYAFGGATYHGGPNGKPYWGNRRAAQLEPADDPYVYRVVATTGERYGFPE